MAAFMRTKEVYRIEEETGHDIEDFFDVPAYDDSEDDPDIEEEETEEG